MKSFNFHKLANHKIRLIFPFLFAIPLSVSAQTNNNHVTTLLNNIMDPQQIAVAIQQDPSFVTWHGDTYLPQPDASVIASDGSTTLTLDEEVNTDFATALANAVSTTSNSLFAAAAQSAAKNIGTQPYTLDFGGAQRDTLASGLAIAKVGITTAIGTSVPYTMTKDGKYVIALSAASLTLVTDFARYTMQEYLKGYLINNKKFTTSAAAWTAYAASQAFGVLMTPVWGYATQIAIAPHFNATTALRRQLLQKLNDDANNYNTYVYNYNYDTNYCRQTQNLTYCNDAQQNLSSSQSYLLNYNNAKAKLALYDSTTFPALSTSTVNPIHSLAIDPYPGYKTQPTTPADYSSMLDSIYNGFISRCDATSNAVEQSVSITCPSASSLYRTRIYLKPLQQDANGNVTVEKLSVNGRGDAVLVGTWTINAKNIDTANYH